MNHKMLLVMPPQRRDKLVNFLSNNGFEVLCVDGAAEASRLLAEPLYFQIVFVDAELPDGSWRGLLPLVVSSQRPCAMVVCTRCGEEQLWAEVLQCGVYDLIPEPYEHPDTLRIIRSALDSQYRWRFKPPVEAMAS